ncbi:MAG: class I SAM-dependent methyltransferase [Candidatus Marinimicrobia bacterium]|nr:class I SAM-dependent methyltransferase [Candidatus Neomarinimicrobiota bacterium]MBL7204004.1 class I SAM-dependent methyltransferase [Desulfobacteraceae bacterium]
MKSHDYEKYAGDYAKLDLTGTFYLAFRDVPELLCEYARGSKALDYGCGAGRSSRFLQTHGFQVVGVDISRAMLNEARKLDPEGEYYQTRSAELPFSDSSFDIILLSFVIVEVASKDEIVAILLEAKRVLNEEGIIVLITSSDDSSEGEWVSFLRERPSGGTSSLERNQIVVRIRNTPIVFHDYVWSESEHREVFRRAGLQLLEAHKPLGRSDDPYKWRDETYSTPVVVYILGKSSRNSIT